MEFMRNHVFDILKDIRKRMENVKKKIAIISGKGGVGKSTVTSLLAISFAKRGKSVGIFDADLYGPSIPKIFGMESERINPGEILKPLKSKKYGIKIMSIQFLLPTDEKSVILRGPVIGSMIVDMLRYTEWDSLDYLFIDLPPGTGDAPLVITNYLKPDGLIVVLTPQELAAFVVEKAIDFSKRANTNIIGIIENMAYMICPHCNREIKISRKNVTEKLCKKYDLKLLARIPMDYNILKFTDDGKIEEIKEDYLKNVNI